MPATTIANLNARLLADISGFKGEMERATTVTTRTTNDISTQFEKLQTKLSKKFSLSAIGMKALKGIGFGSGFAVAEHAADKVVDIFREQAELAKSIEESTAKQLEYTKQIIALHQNPLQQEQTARNEMDRARRELEAAQKGTTTKVATGSSFVGAGAIYTDPSKREVTVVDTAKVAELDAAYKAAAKRVAEFDAARKKATDTEKDAALTTDVRNFAKNNAEILKREQQVREWRKDNEIKVQEEIADTVAEIDKQKAEQFFQNFKRNFDAQMKGEHDLREARSESNAKLVESAESWKDLLDPTREYARQIAEIDRLENGEYLTAKEAADARALVRSKDLVHAAEQLGSAFSNAFESAIIQGEKLGDVMRNLTQDILRMFLRMSVTNPLLNALFGAGGLGVSGWQALPTLFGGPKAEGGPVSAGSTYLVGEKGPELFQPRQSGVIVPNHAMSGGGVVVNLTTNFASGVTRQEVAGMIPRIVEVAKNAVADGVRRGGGYRRAFA